MGLDRVTDDESMANRLSQAVIKELYERNWPFRTELAKADLLYAASGLANYRVYLFAVVRKPRHQGAGAEATRLPVNPVRICSYYPIYCLRWFS
jgi:hypothetical protein